MYHAEKWHLLVWNITEEATVFKLTEMEFRLVTNA